MEAAPHDANNIVIGFGVSSDDGITPLPLLVDATTGRLLVAVTLTPDYVEIVNIEKADANRVPVDQGANDSDHTVPIPLHVDNSTSYLLVDVTI